MTHQDLRNREPKFKGLGAKSQDPWPKPRRTIKLSTVLKALGILVLLVLFW